MNVKHATEPLDNEMVEEVEKLRCYLFGHPQRHVLYYEKRPGYTGERAWYNVKLGAIKAKPK